MTIATQGSASSHDATGIHAEALSSFSKLATITALSLHLIVTQHQAPPAVVKDVPDNVDVSSTPSSSMVPRLASASEVMAQIHRVYDELLTSQVELGDDARRVLYENRWDLYE